MFIKGVIIEGFKSYRERTILGPFHANLNVIVGKNGSGKSNIIYAIQFVLSDEFLHMRKYVRQSVLYCSSGRVLVAAVEIIFDNTDKQLPIPSDVVSICRRVGHNYDQFYINKKVTPYKEMVDVLVSAGFCSCNAYHIVKQGKVNQLATAPDSYRLSVLLEVAGRHVHEDEIAKTKARLEEIKQELDGAKNLMQDLSKRLEVLVQEKKDLETFTGLDKTRCALEYCLYECRLEATVEKLESMKELYSPGLKNQRECRSIQQKAEEETMKSNKLLEDNEKHLSTLTDCWCKSRIEEQEMQSRIDGLVMKKNTLSDEYETVIEQKAQTQDELKTLEERMAQNEKELLNLKPQYEEYKKKEEECTKMLSELEWKRNEIYDRLGRHVQFGTKEERDAWLQDELKSVSKAVEELQMKESRLKEELQKDREQENKLKDEIEGIMNIEGDHQNTVTTLEKHLFSVEEKRVETETMLSELFRKGVDAEQKHSSLQDDLMKARRTLCSLTDKNLIDGLEGLQEVLKKLQRDDESMVNCIDGYCGTLLDNFECSDSLLTAVEVTAGRRLFYHIVATVDVSSRITKEFNRSNLRGEINFFLLDHLSVTVHHYPDNKDALPLIHRLHYEQEYYKAMQYVFGRTLLCRNMEAAFQCAERNNLDCITLDGDQALRTGSLCGGYRDKSKSKIFAYKNYKSLQILLKEAQEEVQKIKDDIKDLRDEMTKYSTEKQKLERKIVNAKSAIEHMKSRRLLLTSDLDGLKDIRAKRQDLWDQWQLNLQMFKARKIDLESELSHEMMSQLSESEQREMDHLNDDIRKLTEECKKMFSGRLQLQYDRIQFLKTTLTKQHEHLSESLENLNEDNISRLIKLNDLVLESAAKDLNAIQEKLRDTEKAIEETKEKQKLIQDKLKSQKMEEANIQQEIDECDEELKLFAANKNTLVTRIEEYNEKICKLGPLPLQEQTKYKNLGTKQIMKLLTDVNKNLKTFHRMNMQAELQYTELCTKQNELKLKIKDMEEGYNGISELLDVLETQKNDAILFTFRQSSENFSKIFKKLVPTGHAQLMMKTLENESVSIEDVTDVSIIKGIGISVCFDTDDTKVQELRETSGGQKSLLALALIFALQKCSPVPFCMLDEVDSMLDSIYRPAFAQLLNELSRNTQVIITSHGHDTFDYVDQFFGVENVNQVSHVNIITKEAALAFVKM